MSLLNVVKASLTVAIVAAVGYAGYKAYKEEIDNDRRNTEEAVKKAQADIAAAVAETERVRKSCQESMAETARKSARDQEEHEAAMQELYLKRLQLANENEEYEALWDRYQAGELTAKQWVAESAAWREKVTPNNQPKAKVRKK